MRKSCVGSNCFRRSAPFVAVRPLLRSPEEPTLGTTEHGGSVATTPAAPRPETLGNERSGSTRRRVIEAGARVFADLGFHAATKERIGAAAGYSHQTVRDYFRTKEGLLGAIVADAWRQVLDAMGTRANEGPLEQLMAAFDALDQLSRARPAEARCVLHEAQIAGPKGGPLIIDEERGFKRAVEQIISNASGARGAAATARAEIVIAAMEALTRPNVVATEGEVRIKFSPEEARQSFAALAESMLRKATS